MFRLVAATAVFNEKSFYSKINDICWCARAIARFAALLAGRRSMIRFPGEEGHSG